jgi:hypothetical protein
MHAITRELEDVLGRLDPQTASLLERTVRNAVAWANRRSVNPTASDNLGYPIGYFEATEGSFAHEPLERPATLPLERREPGGEGYGDNTFW